jgi:hypothetical protein
MQFGANVCRASGFGRLCNQCSRYCSSASSSVLWSYDRCRIGKQPAPRAVVRHDFHGR